MKHPTIRVSAVVAALMLAGVACVQASTTTESTIPSVAVTTTALAPGQVRVATRVAAPFATLAGSQENAVALATALRNGTPATLTYVSGDNVETTTTITPTTKPMGWGNVSHALALAKFSLAQAGITNPTGSDLNAALVGGSITTSDGSSIPLSGVLQQRAAGMGWGAIAHTYGTTMGAVNRGIKAPSSIASTPTSSPVRTTGGLEPKPAASMDRITTARGVASASAGSGKGISNAGGTSTATTSKGLTTAGGTPASTGHGSKGLTTASGTRAGGSHAGMVSAEGGGSGHANGHGRGIVSAAGGSPGTTAASATRAGASAGTVTASGATASGIVTAQPGHGNGNSGNGKGKGGG